MLIKCTLWTHANKQLSLAVCKLMLTEPKVSAEIFIESPENDVGFQFNKNGQFHT